MQQGQLSPWAPREGPSCLPQLLVLPEILGVPWFTANHSDSCLRLHTADCPVCLYGPPPKRTRSVDHHLHCASASLDYFRRGVAYKLGHTYVLW